MTIENLQQTILDTWTISDAINTAVGLTTDSDEQLEHQFEVAYSEYKETIKAIKEDDDIEKFDGLVDLHVTVPTCQMMYAGNKDLLLENPRIQSTGKTFNRLINESQSYMLETEHDIRYFIDAVDCLVDATVALCPSQGSQEKLLKYFNAVNVSNLSKFPEVGSLDPDMECEKIEDVGRYEEVYWEETELLGKAVYVFKSKYDKKNNERFVSGKYLKPPTNFKEVQDLL